MGSATAAYPGDDIPALRPLHVAGAPLSGVPARLNTYPLFSNVNPLDNSGGRKPSGFPGGAIPSVGKSGE